MPAARRQFVERRQQPFQPLPACVDVIGAGFLTWQLVQGAIDGVVLAGAVAAVAAEAVAQQVGCDPQYIGFGVLHLRRRPHQTHERFLRQVLGIRLVLQVAAEVAQQHGPEALRIR